jgi:glutathione S-transferase
MKLYGSAKSRASRSLLALEELGLPYEHEPLRPWDSSADRAVLAAVNPNGRAPVLIDGEVIIWESMAINLYLGDRYGGSLWPEDLAGRAHLYQWSLWSQTEVDVLARHKARFGKDAARKQQAEGERLEVMTRLNTALVGRSYLIGDTFTLADLNVAATLSEPWENGLIDGDLNPSDHHLGALADWLHRCTSRASWGRVRNLP